MIYDDLVQRRFQEASLDRASFTDITKHPRSGGKPYVCAIKEASSNPIVGLSMGSRMTLDLACSVLRYAIATRSSIGTIVHSERVVSTVSATRRAASLHRSMGRVASAADNAAMESFYARLQKDELNHRRPDPRVQLRLAIPTWIERDHHRCRQQAGLGRITATRIEKIRNAATAA